MDNNQRIMTKTLDGIYDLMEQDVKQLMSEEDFELLKENIEMKVLSAFGEYGVGSYVSKPKKTK